MSDPLDIENLDQEQRFDVSSIKRGVKIMSQGFLKIPASLTRVGVLEYTRMDGSKVRELRHPDEVFNPESISTLESAPLITGTHRMVYPENVKEAQVGVVSERLDRVGNVLDGHIVVQDAATISQVQSKELVELSPGYTCRVDRTPGEWNGERYDQIQRKIIYNHVMLLPKGHGRQGSEVSLRMDAAFSAIPEEGVRTMKVRVSLNGIEHEVEVADNAAVAFKSGIENLQSVRMDSANLEGQIAVKDKEIADLKVRLDAALSPVEIEKRVDERMAVVDKAKALLPEVKFDGLSLDEIRKQALVADGFDRVTLDAKDAGFIEGAFSALKVTPKIEGASNELPRVPTGAPAAERMDAKDAPVTSAQARDNMRRANRDAWKGAKE